MFCFLRLKIEIKEDVCAGCGFCASSKPEFFCMSDSGIAQVTKQPDNTQNLQELADMCPFGAIEVTD